MDSIPQESGTAAIDASSNPLTIDQLWNPAGVPAEVLYNFMLDPTSFDCERIGAIACGWISRHGSNGQSYAAFVTSSKKSFSELQRSSQFDNISRLNVAGTAAIQYQYSGDSEETRCNIAWGTRFGSIQVAITPHEYKPRTVIDTCDLTRKWAEAVAHHQKRAKSNTRDQNRALWNPADVPTSIIEREDLRLTGCKKFDYPYLRACLWQQRLLPTERRNGTVHIFSGSQYGMEVAAYSTDFDQLLDNMRPYQTFSRVNLAGTEAVRYSLLPGVCSVAWPASFGTVSVRVIQGEAYATPDQRSINLCSKTTEIAREILPAVR